MLGSELESEELGRDAELATAELGAWLAEDELATAELTGGSELAGAALEGSVEVGPA